MWNTIKTKLRLSWLLFAPWILPGIVVLVLRSTDFSETVAALATSADRLQYFDVLASISGSLVGFLLATLGIVMGYSALPFFFVENSINAFKGIFVAHLLAVCTFMALMLVAIFGLFGSTWTLFLIWFSIYLVSVGVIYLLKILESLWTLICAVMKKTRKPLKELLAEYWAQAEEESAREEQ